MSHLETALRRAIADLDPSDREARRIALGNVRASMLRLLAVYDPPLSAEAIERKIDEVDAYIRAIEADFAPTPARAAVEPTPDAPLASSDFDEEYEAGDEDYVDEDPDEGPFDEDDLEDQSLEGDQDIEPDVDEASEPLNETRGLSVKTLALIAGGLVGFLVILIAGLYLAQQMTLGSTTPTTVEQSAGGTAPAATESAPPSTDTLESTDVPAEAVPPPTQSAPPADNPSESAVAAPDAVPEVVSPAGPPATESLVLFDGHDPSGFKSASDNPVKFEGSADAGFVEISSSASANGARLIVGPGVYQRIAGHDIRIVVAARGARDNPAATLRLAYQNGHQLSGWSDLKLGSDFQSLTMTWKVPKERTGGEGDAILIEPGIPGDQTAADIRSVTIDLLP
ncbi:hypothetical protein SAMN02745157_4747 [Kaistia soli DSM 19436]|uniref:Uncharacterized protein n=1 Tax=Kaistia soli DSM 19436 TaxID=1122133 RepID=A0A1M5MC89_9HYPH|nr:hypothetical protein [Kaistia soli]SHG74865.1 hypothetical protein SAMN02745157_4747 [Kaistia soli DSM 19436]